VMLFLSTLVGALFAREALVLGRRAG